MGKLRHFKDHFLLNLSEENNQNVIDDVANSEKP